MRRLALIWLAGVAFGLTAEWVGFGWGDPRRWIPDLAVGEPRRVSHPRSRLND